MPDVTGKMEDDQLVIAFSGTVDSTNADETEENIRKIRELHSSSSIILDFEKLNYISSAGLRIVLRLKQEVKNVIIINVRPEVYSVLEMTGFTEMMTVRKKYRVLSISGCELIGRGSNGKVYQIDPETVAKVYIHDGALPNIHREQALSRAAFIAGIPTAIPYDVVRIKEGGYATVFELLNAVSFADLLISGEKSLDEIVKMSDTLLKLIHSKRIDSDFKIPAMKPLAQGWIDDLNPFLENSICQRLRELIKHVPDHPYILHGDYHIKNIMYQNGESLLIDLDTISYGHPVFELGSMYNVYVGFGEVNPDSLRHFLGISVETAAEIWKMSLSAYLGTSDRNIIQETEKKAQIIGMMRLMRRKVRRGGMETAEGRYAIDYYHNRLRELVPQVDTLEF